MIPSFFSFLSNNLSIESSVESFFSSIYEWLVANRLAIGDVIVNIILWVSLPIMGIFLIYEIIDHKRTKNGEPTFLSYKLTRMWNGIILKSLYSYLIVISFLSLIWPEYVDSILLVIISLVSLGFSIYDKVKFTKLQKYCYLLQKKNIEKGKVRDYFDIVETPVSNFDSFTEKQTIIASIGGKQAIKFSINKGLSKAAYCLTPKHENIEENLGFISEQINLHEELDSYEKIGEFEVIYFTTKDVSDFFDQYIGNNPFFDKMTIGKLVAATLKEVKAKYLDDLSEGSSSVYVTDKFSKSSLQKLNDTIFLNADPKDAECIDPSYDGRARYKGEQVNIWISIFDKYLSYRIFFIGPNVRAWVDLLNGVVTIGENSVPAGLEKIIRNWVHENRKNIINVWNIVNPGKKLTEEINL